MEVQHPDRKYWSKYHSVGWEAFPYCFEFWCIWTSESQRYTWSWAINDTRYFLKNNFQFHEFYFSNFQFHEFQFHDFFLLQEWLINIQLMSICKAKEGICGKYILISFFSPIFWGFFEYRYVDFWIYLPKFGQVDFSYVDFIHVAKIYPGKSYLAK